MKGLFYLGFSVIFALFIFSCNSSLSDEELLILTGVWEGKSNDFAKTPKPDSLFPIVSINILSDGKVEGKAGDATFKDCYIEKNRGSIAKSLNVETDYIIEGFLVGKINKRDSLGKVERNISIPFNVENDSLRGTLFIVESWKYPNPILPKVVISKK